MAKDKALRINSAQSGHRKRLKERFSNSSVGSLPDYEILEMILFMATPRRDTKPLARLLLKRFGSIKGVFFADPTELANVSGITTSTINLMRLLEDFFSRLYKPDAKNDETILNNWNNVLNYCTLTMGFKKHECLRVLYLDKRNKLLADQLMQEGTVDKVAIYPREILKQCLAKGASAVIIVHNHPSGEAKPSQEDTSITQQINDALKIIGISLHDHVIVAKEKHFSFRANGLLN